MKWILWPLQNSVSVWSGILRWVGTSDVVVAVPLKRAVKNKSKYTSTSVIVFLWLLDLGRKRCEEEIKVLLELLDLGREQGGIRTENIFKCSNQSSLESPVAFTRASIHKDSPYLLLWRPCFMKIQKVSHLW